jgi:hypothetical protein
VEDYKHGYPRLAAFLTLDKNFAIVRCFNTLHMRVLLDYQDRLAELEEQLNDCDDNEGVQLNLCSRRQDSNPRRREILDRLKQELKDYGTGQIPTRILKEG